MQTKMTKLSTTLNAEEGTWVESEEKDTSEGVVSFAPGTFLMSTFNDHYQINRLVKNNNNKYQP